MLNLSLPYIALETLEECKDGNEHSHIEIVEKFFEKLDFYITEVFDRFEDKFELLARRKGYNFPFLMGQHMYEGSEGIGPTDEIREAIKNGTLTLGFIGLSETLVALIGKHHGESEEAQELGLKIVRHMYDRCVQKAQETHLNYGLMGSPAEGACGRLLRLARKRFGVVKGVTDKEWFTNSHHIDVRYKISVWDKIRLEAPYHEFEPAGGPREVWPAYNPVNACQSGVDHGLIG